LNRVVRFAPGGAILLCGHFEGNEGEVGARRTAGRSKPRPYKDGEFD